VGVILRRRLHNLRRLRRLYRARYPVLAEIVQYGLVGLSGLAVDLLAFTCLMRLFGVPHLLSRAISFVVAATWNWAWNRRFTFECARTPRQLPQWTAFLAVSALGFLVNWGVYYLLTKHSDFFFAQKELALCVGVVVGFAFNYLGSRYYVFRRRRGSARIPA
jgi:dolichol-phosphate mannosyltransferase